MRPTVAEIDLSAIRSNIRTLKMKSKDLLLVAVKANAYGHGDVAVSLACEDAGADFLGVATIEEGIHLRESAIDLPILIMGGTLTEDYNKLCLYELSVTVYRKEQIEELGNLGKQCRVHLKIDTGMGRIGIQPEDLDEYLDVLDKYPNLVLEGVMSHLAVADEETGADYTRDQIRIFDMLLDRIFCRGHKPIVHLFNSAATFSYSADMPYVEGRRYMNRVGISAYGYSYVNTAPSELKKAMEIKTQIVNLKTIHRGQCVSYGCEFVAIKDTDVATVPIGYGDGYKRSYKKGYMIVNGEKAKVLGRVCMDQTMIDVTGIPDVQVGSYVTVMGEDEGESVWADTLADWDDTISYEVLTSVSYRVPRRNYNEIED